MSSDLKFEITPYFEWCTDLPEINRCRESPGFFLCNNNEWHFQLLYDYRSHHYAYRVYLKLKTKHCEVMLRNAHFIVGFRNETMLNLDRGNFIVCEKEPHLQQTEVWIKSDDELKKSLPPDFSEGNWLKFRFYFHDMIEAIIRKDKKVDTKFTQTNLTLSLQNQVDCLCSDLGELMEKETHSDVQLVCKDGKIRAHKAILAVRSKWFADKFKEGSTENLSEVVDLSTIDMSVMKLCLEYIYKGKISQLPPGMASKLYGLGHIWKIPSLVKMCADLMVSNLSKDNYINCLNLAAKYDDDYFKCGIIDYISNNANMLKKRKIDEISK